MGLNQLKDMRKTPEEKMEDMISPIGAVNDYPYGLCIRLTQDELEKLDVDHSDWKIGDIFDLRSLARVTSVSENETESGKRCCVELQILMLGAESEAEEAEPVSRVKRQKEG